MEGEGKTSHIAGSSFTISVSTDPTKQCSVNSIVVKCDG